MLGGAITELTGVPESGHRFLPGYREAVAARVADIAAALARQRCDELLARLEIDRDDAALAVWDGEEGSTVRALLCQLAEHGHEVAGFEAPGLLSSVATLSVTPADEPFQRISLHEGEVAPDTRMLVGFETRDANETRQLSVADWERFVARHAGDEAGTAHCERLLGTPVEQLSVNDRMAAMGCIVGAAARQMKTH